MAAPGPLGQTLVFTVAPWFPLLNHFIGFIIFYHNNKHPVWTKPTELPRRRQGAVHDGKSAPCQRKGQSSLPVKMPPAEMEWDEDPPPTNTPRTRRRKEPSSLLKAKREEKNRLDPWTQ